MHGESIRDVSQVQKTGCQLIRQIAVSKIKLPPASVKFHLDLTGKRFDMLNLEYWPVYLVDLKNAGEAYFRAGYSVFETLVRHQFPAENAQQFIDCVNEFVHPHKNLASVLR